eukprot:gene16162-22323_t
MWADLATGTGLGGTNVVVSTMSPACANTTVSATTSLGTLVFTSNKATVIPTSSITSVHATVIPTSGITSMRATVIPTSGITSMRVSARVASGCNDQYVAMLLVATSNPFPLAITPPPQCPCWTLPAADGNKAPKACARASSFPSPSPPSAAKQCIDPANFDPYTGRMAYSYCWRYACLPDQFSYSTFTATMTNLTRYNIPRMPGGATFNTSILATVGVQVEVTATAAESNDKDVYFVGTGYYNVGNVTLPTGGILSMDFKYTVPIGFDDLSAAVVMDAWPGPPPPAPPPFPPGALCGCPSVPDASGNCSTSTAFTTVYLTENRSVSTTMCIPSPGYDRFTNVFAFSYCWRWSCLPDAFDKKPYTIEVLGITEYDIAFIPTGEANVQFLKPAKVNMTLQGLLVDGTTLGPFNVNSGLNIPEVGLASLDAILSIPAMPWLDANSGAVLINPGPLSPSPPPSPPRPPSPPLPNANDNTLVVSNFVLLQELGSQEELDSIISSTLSNLQSQIDGYLLNIPTGFSDFSAVPDCSSESQQAFLESVAVTLGVTAADLTSTCTYGYVDIGSRRRGRSLMQTACEAQKIRIDLSLNVVAAAVANTNGGLNTIVSQTQGSLFNAFNDTVCVGAESRSTLVAVSQPQYDQEVTSVCGSQMNVINLPERQKIQIACYTTQNPNPSDSGGDDGLNGGVLAGIIVGSLVGVAVLVGGALYVRKRVKRSEEQGGEADKKPPNKFNVGMMKAEGGSNSRTKSAVAMRNAVVTRLGAGGNSRTEEAPFMSASGYAALASNPAKARGTPTTVPFAKASSPTNSESDHSSQPLMLGSTELVTPGSLPRGASLDRGSVGAIEAVPGGGALPPHLSEDLVMEDRRESLASASRRSNLRPTVPSSSNTPRGSYSGNPLLGELVPAPNNPMRPTTVPEGGVRKKYSPTGSVRSSSRPGSGTLPPSAGRPGSATQNAWSTQAPATEAAAAAVAAAPGGGDEQRPDEDMEALVGKMLDSNRQ